MNPVALKALLALPALLAPTFMVSSWLRGAEARLQASDPAAAEGEVAIASVAEDAYCTPRLKSIVRRVAGACGLLGDSGRGCQPMQAKQVAQLTDDEFNALFRPLAQRAHIVQFDADQTDLDAAVFAVCDDLAAQMQADGEGVTKRIVITVEDIFTCVQYEPWRQNRYSFSE